MKIKEEDLPKCQLIFGGHTLDGIDNTIIESGDCIRIIAPKSKYHKVICVFEKYHDNTIFIHYKDEFGEIKYSYIHPGEYYLTWKDFSFEKIEALEDINK
jgi:hypothetical protein